MNLSVIAAGVTIILILIFGWISYKYEAKPEPPDISRFPFNESTGKERSFVNKTGDSSMWTESARRKVISQTHGPDGSGFRNSKRIKDSKHTKGSTSGAIEAFFISAFRRCCPSLCCETTIYNGNGSDGCVLDGNVQSDCCSEIFYDGDDSGVDVLDGNVEKDCSTEIIYDGLGGVGSILDGNVLIEYCTEFIYDGQGTDGAVLDGNVAQEDCCSEIVYDGNNAAGYIFDSNTTGDGYNDIIYDSNLS